MNPGSAGQARTLVPPGPTRSPSMPELFAPSTVAVLGASNRPGSVGGSLFRNILRSGFRGVVYPVNPSSKSIAGVRCYANVAELPEVPELAVVIVPARGVPSVVEELGRAGTRGVVVISSGFGEVGGEGVVLERDLAERARRFGMTVVGPNCFGLFNTDPEVSLNATFSNTLPRPGGIAMVSQSGALGAGILQYADTERIGFSRFVSVGNRAGVDENALIGSLSADPRTRVIVLYLESLADGRRFLEAAREVTEQTPILVIKSGRTPAGERAAKSHTGSLAESGRDELYDSLFRQAGVIRADSLEELFRGAKLFASGRRIRGPRLAILTNSGGPGIIAADAAIRNGLELPPLPPPLAARLSEGLPSIATVANPLDMTADITGSSYREALRILSGDDGLDGIVVIATPTGTVPARSIAEAIVEGAQGSDKTIVACLFGLTDLSAEVAFLEDAGIPSYTFPEEAVQGLGLLARYRSWLARPRTEVRSFPVDPTAVHAAFAAARQVGTLILPEYRARSALAAYGIRFPASAHVRSVEEGTRAAATIGYPVVLKVASPDISHKTEVGGVARGIDDEAGLRAAWERMEKALDLRAPTARREGYEVEEEIRGGKEVLVGMQRDREFGPILVFGLGGIYVEAFHDVTFRLAPIRARSARLMIESIRSYPLLAGVRGEPPGDLEALEEVLERVSQFAIDLPEVAELDLNPLIVRPRGSGVVAVDARVVLGPGAS